MALKQSFPRSELPLVARVLPDADPMAAHRLVSDPLLPPADVRFADPEKRR
jgi:hypothetical protein